MNEFYRGRRLRRNPVIREMVRETQLSAADLMMLYFVVDTTDEDFKKEIPSMPGQYQLSLKQLEKTVGEAVDAGLRSLMLFGIPKHKDAIASEAYAPNGIVQRAIRMLKAKWPELQVVTDVVSVRIHFARSLRHPEGRRHLRRSSERSHTGTACQDRPQPCRGRCGHGGAFRHDGRTHPGYPRSAGQGRVCEYADHVLCGEIRLRVLRPVPRRGRSPPRITATARPIRWTRPMRWKACAKPPPISTRARTSSW